VQLGDAFLEEVLLVEVLVEETLLEGKSRQMSMTLKLSPRDTLVSEPKSNRVHQFAINTGNVNHMITNNRYIENHDKQSVRTWMNTEIH
jgi:hypothetical protein